MKRIAWLLATLAVLVALNVALPRIVNAYVYQVAVLCGINVVLAVSLNLINGFTGQFSIGHAGFMALGAYTSAAITYYGGPAILKAMGVDAERPKTVEGYTATLGGSKGLVVGREATITYSITKDGKPADDLLAKGLEAPYLTIVSQDLKQCTTIEASGAREGPFAAFVARFDRPGLYRVWGEFKSGTRTLVFPFVVEVAETEKPATK